MNVPIASLISELSPCVSTSAGEIADVEIVGVRVESGNDIRA
jgi:hypothetical protein